MKKKYYKTIGIAVLVLIIITIYILFDTMACWAYPYNDNRNGVFLKDIFGVAGGLIILVGLFISYRRTKSFEDSVKNTKETNLNEQFKNAVEHLGSESEPIILGGVAELNGLADNHPEKFAQVVMDILSSYCRSEASIDKQETPIKWNVIQSIIEYLGKAKHFKNFEINLSNTNLKNVKIDKMNLNNWNFTNSILPEWIGYSKFNNCNFNDAKLLKGNLYSNTIENCSLEAFLVEESNISIAKISGASIGNMIFIDSQFSDLVFDVGIELSTFINCRFAISKFKKDIYSNEFLLCSFYLVRFEPKMLSNIFFIGGLFSETQLSSSLSGVQFKGARLEKSVGLKNLESKIQRILRSEKINLDQVVKINKTHSLVNQDFLDVDATYISKAYNSKILDKEKSIKIPHNWS